MSDADKKMKKYLAAIARRLNLPGKVKSRVMSDLKSSVDARRENGMTDEAIYAELGSPKKAAADLNEQMKEYAYRKSPWRFLFAAAAIYGGWELIMTAFAWLLYLSLPDPFGAAADAASIGVIGGADGPTAIFVTTAVPSFYHWILPMVLLAVGIWGFLRLSRCRQK